MEDLLLQSSFRPRFYTCKFLSKIACNWIIARRMKEKLIKTGVLKASLYERNSSVRMHRNLKKRLNDL